MVHILHIALNSAAAEPLCISSTLPQKARHWRTRYGPRKRFLVAQFKVTLSPHKYSELTLTLSGIRGLLEIEPGDALLARPLDREGVPEHDCLQALSGVLYVLCNLNVLCIH